MKAAGTLYKVQDSGRTREFCSLPPAAIGDIRPASGDVQPAIGDIIYNLVEWKVRSLYKGVGVLRHELYSIQNS